MIPQIALDLSLDSITVLSRAPEDGWWREGTVRLSEPDMPERLAGLRDVAEARVGAGFLSILVLPDSQLLYTSLERDDRRPDDTIRALLRGRTPYAVEDLTWDYVERGDRLQVAVVALDTLIEAETFAAEYGFRPVAVVANPKDPAYPGIPEFGKTGLAGDLLGGAPLELALGEGFRATPAPPLPEPEPEPELAPEPEAEDVTAEAEAASPATEDGVTKDEPEAPIPTFRRSRAEPAPGEGDDAFGPPRSEAPASPESFASARAASAAPPVARTASGERLARIAPRLTAQPGGVRSAPWLPTPADIEATGKRDARYPGPRPTAAEPSMTANAAPSTSFDAPKKSDPHAPETPAATAPKVPPVAAPGSFAAHLKRRAADPEAVAEWHAEAESRAAEGTAPAPAPKAKRYDVAPEDAPASLAARIKRRAEETKAQEKAAQKPKGDAPEAAALALPGLAREAAAARRGGRLGLMMTLGLLAVLILVGVAATLMAEEDGDLAAPPMVPASVPLVERAELSVAAPAGLPPETAPEAAPATATEIDLAILLPEPGSVTTGSATPSVIAAPEPIEGPVLTRLPDLSAAAEDPLQADVAPNLAEAPALDTAPNAETTPAVFIEIWEADGAFEAPDLAAPPALPADPLTVVASLDPVLAGLSAPGLPAQAAAPDMLAPRLNPPPAELVESRAAALGLVPATFDWTILPEGYALLRGRPATLPRARPGGEAEARLAALAEAAPDPVALETAAPDAPEGGEGLVLVAATADGTVAPGGYTVLQGRPATLPLRRPDAVEEAEAPGTETEDIAATPDGVVAPGGYTLVLGRPEILPEPRPGEEDASVALASTEAAPFPADAPLAVSTPEPAAELSEEDAILRRVRPVERPGAVDGAAAARAAELAAEAEAAEAELAAQSAETEAALAEMRRTPPRQRPEAIATAAAEAEAALRAAQDATEQAAIDAAQQAAAASLANAAAQSAQPPAESISDLALLQSERPRTRPRSVERDAARIVTQRREVAAATTQPRQPEASPDNGGSQQIRSAGGNVARAATQENAIRLNEINLIGVYGRSNARRALVRLSNGRYVKVEVGDRLDRGRVVAIGDDRLQYQRGGRNVVLSLPQT
ncbi:hypothetical protein [Jannaschia formosa]|uniref:hypothetical protein n=1 Tax=Jannaschia formosa TaxID=2259592 RepID=UPI000E1B9D5C|nr:hypothetical protein [Jannaschia formosa]TFL18627.1 hypothetical protein DR046_09120 [Jannaschia formosa]